MIVTFRLLTAPVALLLVGCGSAVVRSESAHALGNATLVDLAVVELGVADEAVRERHFPEALDIDQIRRLIDARLEDKGLLAEQRSSRPWRVVVEITDARIRARWVATMWGPMAGTDRIHARVMLFDPDNVKVNHFNVMTSYALGGVVGGATSLRVPWVYERFADEVVDALTGATSVTLMKEFERKPLPRMR